MKYTSPGSVCAAASLPRQTGRSAIRAFLCAIACFLFALFSVARADNVALRIVHDEQAESIAIRRVGSDEPILTHRVRADFRPYLHPIASPDGKGMITQYSPAHHPHQSGLYWGLTRVNGRDYFHNPGGDYWRRASAKVLHGDALDGAESVQWQTAYDLLDELGQPVMTETQTWTMRAEQGAYTIDLKWSATARRDLVIGKYDYGGLFLRMPWDEGVPAEVRNAARQRNRNAEGQRAPWIDLGMEVEPRDDPVHVALFDHPENRNYPQSWRVDGQFGVGSAPVRLGDWKLAKGEKAMLRHRLYVYTGPFNDVEVSKRWTEFSGRNHEWALWGLAQQEGRQAELLSPAEAVAAMEVPAGFEATAWAAEPMITQPMAFCWDDRGRLWIAENRDYENRGKGFARSGDSRILILEDSNNDGKADRRQVFLEGIPFPAAIAVGFDGLWLGAPPNLLFVPDRDRDDRADRNDIEVRLTGWGIRDRHETLNSLHWGPDGWLYGCQGFATPSRVGRPASQQYEFQGERTFPKDFHYDGPTTELDGGVWRYHPTKRRFEVVAHGFSNPWGIDYDEHGQLFITACVIPHLWHVIPGGIYHRQGGQHINPHFYSDIRTIADHRHRSAHGGARIYLADAFPEKYHGRIFMANIHEHAVLTDVLQRRGSGFIGRHGDDFCLANNAHWIGFGIEIGPDGALYVLDWHDADICGKEVVYKDTGRVFRIAPTQSLADHQEKRPADLGQLSDVDLAHLQRSASAWHARRARVILQSRAADAAIHDDAVAALRLLFRDSDHVPHRLRAMWALHAIAAWSPGELTAALEDPSEYVRGWAIQLLCEDNSAPPAARERFAMLARDDPSPVVRLYLSSALQRMNLEERWPIALELVQRAEDAEDHNLPKMTWFGIEPAVPLDSARSLELAAVSRLPLVTRHVARRMTDAGQIGALLTALSNLPDNTDDMLRGIRAALARRDVVAPPHQWNHAYQALQSAGGNTAALAREVAAQLGDEQVVLQRLAVLRSDSASATEKQAAIRELGRRGRPQLRPLLVDLLDDPQLRRAAIQAAAAYDDLDLGRELLARYPHLTAAERLDVIHALAARRGSGVLLTEAIADDRVPRRDVPAYVARLLRRVVGPRFVDVWGTSEGASQDETERFARYRALLTAGRVDQANVKQGQQVFAKTCAACHRLNGAGGEIGPDLTGANRGNLEYLLGNVLTPSAVIQDAYRMQVVLTDEGRAYSGTLAQETDEHLLLRVVESEQPVVIRKASIDDREVATVSMMPDGILANLSDDEVLDLFAYLMTIEPQAKH